MTRVFIWPTFTGDDQGDGGVRRVVEAQHKYLPAQGIEIVETPDEADVLACHIQIPEAYLISYAKKPLVAHVHGFYWAEYDWPRWALDANKSVSELVRVSDAVTAPSEWVAQTIRRHFSRRANVIPHGVDVSEFTRRESSGYVLWNKNRPDPVCDPSPMLALAAAMPETQFVTTFGQERANVKTVGRVSYDESKRLLERAGVYLATTRETFGIGTLEAMAAGVPVVGFAFGAQPEIITHGSDGWLARPGDIRGLAEGVRWALDNRDAVASAARKTAESYTWERAAAAYARLYGSFHRVDRQPRVSVVVTAYKLDKYLNDCLESVAAQTEQDFECVVVDDASPDRCGEIADEWAKRDPRFRAVHNETNLHQAGARNAGVAAAKSGYILPLDADDRIAPETVKLLADALDSDKKVHVAYGKVRFYEEDGETLMDYGPQFERGHSSWPLPFDYALQLNAKPYNLLPYSSMFRRSAWELTGGYRRRAKGFDDPDFWCRLASYGFRPKMVTEADTLLYRVREDSMSNTDPARGRWIKWFPWARLDDIAPAGAVTDAQLPIPSLEPVLISVVIPVGPGHEQTVMTAIDSLDAQSFRHFECIVVKDTPAELPNLPPWVRVVSTEVSGSGPGAARNLGVRHSKAPLLLFLDADDYLQPMALDWLFRAFEEHRDVIYPDFFEDYRGEGHFTIYDLPDYDARELLKGNICSCVMLMSRRQFDMVGGYDEHLKGWEDWDFQLRLADAGVCMRRFGAPLFTYRKHTGMRRESAMQHFEANKADIISKWGDVLDGRRVQMACGCQQKSTIVPPQTQMLRGSAPEGARLMRYTGPKQGATLYKGASGTMYSFAAGDPPTYVLDSDIQRFIEFGEFEVVSEGPREPVAQEPTLVASA